MPVCDHDTDYPLAEPLDPVRQPIDLVVGDCRVDQERIVFAGDERAAQRRSHRPDPSGQSSRAQEAAHRGDVNIDAQLTIRGHAEGLLHKALAFGQAEPHGQGVMRRARGEVQASLA
jgi:hypothetical protein